MSLHTQVSSHTGESPHTQVSSHTGESPHSQSCLLPLQLQVGHGSVGGQEGVGRVGLHAAGVAVQRRLVPPLFEVRVSLETVVTATDQYSKS